MSIFTVAYYDILRFLRDRKTLIEMVLLPIILILILGTALDKAFDVNHLDKIDVLYVNEDKGRVSGSFDEFLDNKEVKDVLNCKEIESLDEAKKLLSERKTEAIIYVGEGFSDRVLKGEKSNIELYTYDNTKFKFSIVENLVKSYVEGFNGVEAIYRMSGVSSGNDREFQREQVVEEENISIEGKKPRAIDYYAVTMLIMIMMYGASYGVEAAGESYMMAVGRRIGTTPIKPYENFIGKLLAIVFTLSWQFTALILFSKFIYKANFGQNIPMIIFICFSLVILTTSLGVGLCMIFKSKQVANRVLEIIIPIFTFISGGYVPMNFPNMKVLSKIMNVIPNNLAQKSIFNVVYGGSNLEIRNNLIIMWTLSIIIFVVGMIAGRRESR